MTVTNGLPWKLRGSDKSGSHLRMGQVPSQNDPYWSMRSVDFTPQIDPVNLCVAAQSMGHIFGIHGEYNTPKLLNFPANYPTAIWRVVMIFGAHVKLRPSTVSLATSRLAPPQDKGPLVYQESKLFNGEAIGVSADLLGVFLWPMIGDFTGSVKRYQGTKTINTWLNIIR